MVRLVRHRQTKGAATDRPHLRPPRHILTLPQAPIRIYASPESGGLNHSPLVIFFHRNRDRENRSRISERRLVLASCQPSMALGVECGNLCRVLTGKRRPSRGDAHEAGVDAGWQSVGLAGALYYEIRAAPSLPRPLGEGWGEGTIRGEATFHHPGWLGSPHDR
jgi:hypothetical protein